MKKLFLALLLVVVLSYSVQAALTDNLIRYYTMNETVTLTDSVYGLNPTDSGVTKGKVGIIDKAIQIENTNYLNLGFNLGKNNISLAFWFNYSGNKELAYILQSDDGGYDFDIGYNASGALFFTNGTGTTTTNYTFPTGKFNFIVFTMNNTQSVLWVNGSIFWIGGGGSTMAGASANNFYMGKHSSAGFGYGNYTIDEFGMWNRSLTASEVSSLYCSGAGITYNFTSCNPSTNTISVTLVVPNDTAVQNFQATNFSGSFATNSQYNLTNGTLYLWNKETSALITTLNKSFTGYTNATSYAYNVSIGEYYWNIKACGTNVTGGRCDFATANYTLIVGAINLSEYYLIGNVSETSRQYFNIVIGVPDNSTLLLGQLVYSGKNYTVSNITASGNNYTLERYIDIPLVNNVTEIKSFFWRFTFSNSVLVVQETTARTQNVSRINFTICGGSFTTKYLNFTTKNEVNNTVFVNSSIQANYEFWLGSGTVKKNYSYSDMAGNRNSYAFCASPQDTSFYVTGQNLFDATDYNERYYNLDNATLTNTTTENTVYLIPDTLGTKFFFDVRDATSVVSNALVYVQKKFISTGQYTVVAIARTDESGKFTEYLEQDRDYQYIVVKNGVVLATIKKSAICAATPCEQTLYISEGTNQFYNAYNSAFASNVVYTLTFDKPTKIVTYTFLDTTGLARYFRLEVQKTYNNATGTNTICSETLNAVSGTLTCNLTGYNGDFIIRGYISRSPEVVVNFFTVAIEAIAETLGMYGLLMAIILILVVVFSGLYNPAVALILTPFMLITLKFLQFLELGWATISGLTLVCLLIAWQVRT